MLNLQAIACKEILIGMQMSTLIPLYNLEAPQNHSFETCQSLHKTAVNNNKFGLFVLGKACLESKPPDPKNC